MLRSQGFGRKVSALAARVYLGIDDEADVWRLLDPDQVPYYVEAMNLMSDVQKSLVVTIVLAIEDLDNDELAAANNAVHGFGRINSGNKAYRKLREKDLIRDDGVPVEIESLKDALAFEVNKRVEAGTFV